MYIPVPVGHWLRSAPGMLTLQDFWFSPECMSGVGCSPEGAPGQRDGMLAAGSCPRERCDGNAWGPLGRHQPGLLPQPWARHFPSWALFSLIMWEATVWRMLPKNVDMDCCQNGRWFWRYMDTASSNTESWFVQSFQKREWEVYLRVTLS